MRVRIYLCLQSMVMIMAMITSKILKLCCIALILNAFSSLYMFGHGKGYVYVGLCKAKNLTKA